MKSALIVIGLAACTPTAPGPAPVVPPGVAPTGAREVVFEGMCDASDAVEISATRFVVADDEDNLLRVYDAERGGPPLAAVDVSVAVGLVPEGKKQKMPELDLEAASRIGDRAYWLTSHGRDSKARNQPSRFRFFATTVPSDGAPLTVVGTPYETLLADLLADPRLAGFGLAAASELPPKAAGGLNLEGMTSTPQGTLLLGFRNPVPGGRALLVELLDPGALIAGGPARFGELFQLALDGDGVRALTWWRGRYLVIAGGFGSGGTSRMLTWDRASPPVALPIDLTGYNPEGAFTPEDRDEIMLLSDDGERVIDGRPCKKLKDPAQRRFRGLWIDPSAQPSGSAIVPAA